MLTTIIIIYIHSQKFTTETHEQLKNAVEKLEEKLANQQQVIKTILRFFLI